MQELTNAECDALSALLVRVGRPHSPEDRAALEAWVLHLSRGRPVDTHDTDLLA